MTKINAISNTEITYDKTVAWDEMSVQENIATAHKRYYYNSILYHPDYYNLWGIREVLYTDEYKNLHYTKKVDLYLDGDEVVTKEYFVTGILNKMLKTKLGLEVAEYIKFSRVSP